MLKKLFKEGYLNVDKILLDNYSKMDLDEIEAVVLIQMFNLTYNGKNVNIKNLRTKLSLSGSKIGEIIDSLSVKGFISIDVVVKNDKQETVIKVYNALDLINDFLLKEKQEQILEENENAIKKIIKLCEEEFNRELSSNELFIISHWVEDGTSYETVKWALLDAVKSNHFSLSYIDRIISNGQIQGNN